MIGKKLMSIEHTTFNIDNKTYKLLLPDGSTLKVLDFSEAGFNLVLFIYYNKYDTLLASNMIDINELIEIFK